MVIRNSPPTYASVNGDVIFTVYDDHSTDAVTYPNYKYVLDLYDHAGNMIYRAKVFPNPENNCGVFNIAPILRTYINLQLNPTADAIVAQEFANEEFFMQAMVKIGEEYGYTTYSNILEDSERLYYNHYNNRIIGAQTILGDYTNKKASTAPIQLKTLRGNHWLFLPFFNIDIDDLSIYTEIFDKDGLVDTNTYVPGVGHPELLQLNISPKALQETLLQVWGEGITRYTVSLNDTLVADVSIIDECIHTPYTLHFLNQFGGFETYVFPKVSRKTYDGEKKSFTQLPYRMDSSGVLNYANSNGVVHDNKTTYASKYNEKLKLTTDLLTDEEYRWLRQLVFSPLVYIEQDSKLVPVTVTNSNYEDKKFVNDKLTTLSVDLDFGVQLNTQFR